MRIFEIINEDLHGTMQFVDPAGKRYEAVPLGGSWKVWSGNDEWELDSHTAFADFIHQYNLKPVSSPHKQVGEDFSNAYTLTGSGRADPHGKKPGKDSAAHRKVRTPGTTYSKSRKKHNQGAKPGAVDGFVG